LLLLLRQLLDLLRWVALLRGSPDMHQSELVGRRTPLLKLHEEDRLQRAKGKMLLLPPVGNETNAAELRLLPLSSIKEPERNGETTCAQDFGARKRF